MIVLLWIIPYYAGTWNYFALAFYGGVVIGLIYEMYARVQQAKQDHLDEIELKEIFEDDEPNLIEHKVEVIEIIKDKNKVS